MEIKDKINVACETCQGEGEVFQESGAGIHATANLGWAECPDCDGEGEFEMDAIKVSVSKVAGLVSVYGVRKHNECK